MRIIAGRRGADGFSLIEITVVLVLLSLMLVLGVTGFQSVILPRRVQHVARELGSMMRSAQQAATASAAGNRCVGVVVGATNAEVRTVSVANTTIDCDNPTAATFSGGTLLSGENYPQGVSLAVSTGGTTGIIAFLPSGAPCAGSNCLRNVAVTAGGSTRRVCVANGTGLVEIVEGATCP
jgi:prepilin-type N-terminal cleavage/methylation domain-containing protein